MAGSVNLQIHFCIDSMIFPGIDYSLQLVMTQWNKYAGEVDCLKH